ncbi:hypothetical protein K2X85_07935 [bacterium]|nr:hypothetical protein [bacterium]
MKIDISDTFAALLAENRGVDPNHPEATKPPDYGITATFETGFIDLVLTFRRDSAYCCMEWGCHLGFVSGEHWVKLRQALWLRKTTVPDRLRLHLRCIIEDGAKFYDLSRPNPTRRGVYAFKTAEAWCYELSVAEMTACDGSHEDATP